MKSLSIHGIDGRLELRIREKAAEYGMSVNKTLKKIIGDSIEGKAGSRPDRHDFDDLCGALSAQAGEELAGILSEMDRIDPEKWR